MARRRWAILAAVALAAIACQAVIGIEDPRSVPDVDDCGQRHPPGPPRAADQDLPDGGVLTFAIRSYTIRPRDGGIVGYDLDDRCTGAPGALRRPPCLSPEGGADASDDPFGVDNAFARAAGGNQIALGDDPAADAIEKNVRAGSFTVLLQLARWNGRADDPEVVVSLLTGLKNHRPGQPDDRPDAAYVAPVWDHNDSWSYPDDVSIVEGVALTRATGYVTGNVVVARQPDTALSFRLGAGSVNLRQGVITARITPQDDGTVALTDGVVAGRISSLDLLSFVNQIKINDSEECLPRDDAVQAIERALCNFRDMPLSPANDGMDLPCDALSFGFGFESAVLSKLGDRVAALRACPLADASCP